MCLCNTCGVIDRICKCGTKSSSNICFSCYFLKIRVKSGKINKICINPPFINPK